jgi:hypothetical protein
MIQRPLWRVEMRAVHSVRRPFSFGAVIERALLKKTRMRIVHRKACESFKIMG